MSMLRPLNVTCPSCQVDFAMEAAVSVNADRRPDLREAILSGAFQVQTCPHCAASFRLDPQLNYLDIGQGQWISAQPLSRLREWIEDEDEAVATFDKAYGASAGASAREVGQGLVPRLVFGWPALREKIVARSHQLDDVALELSKLAIIDGLKDQPLAAGNELRLEAVQGDAFQMNWVKAQTETVVERMQVPRELYDGIVAAPQAWAKVRAALQTGPFVDIQKLYMGRGREA